MGRQLATNPLVLLAIAGAGWSAFRVPLPEPVTVMLTTLGNATGPCALMAIGLYLARPLTERASAIALRAAAAITLPSLIFAMERAGLLHP